MTRCVKRSSKQSVTLRRLRCRAKRRTRDQGGSALRSVTPGASRLDLRPGGQIAHCSRAGFPVANVSLRHSALMAR
jgi:hypothetical protein